MCGSETERFLRQFNVDKVFFGAAAVHLKRGVTHPVPEEVSTNRLILDIAAKRYLVCDSSKFDGVSLQQAEAAKRAHPEAKLLVHPECRKEVVALADYVGSTAGILETARKDPAGSFIIGTENGVTDILVRELPLSHIYALKPDFICPDMKKTTLEDVLACFEGRRTPIELPQAELDGARKSLERMIAVQ